MNNERKDSSLASFMSCVEELLVQGNVRSSKWDLIVNHI